jgi:hypothetical protein
VSSEISSKYQKEDNTMNDKATWNKAIEKGGFATYVLHSELRVAVMTEDVGEIRRLVEIEGIPVGSFDHLAETVARYHDKQKSLATLLEMSNL